MTVSQLSPRRPNPQIAIGQTRQTRLAGTLYEDFLPQLRGKKATKVWEEMSSNDATVGGVLHGIATLIKRDTWRVDPADDTPQAEAAAELVAEEWGRLDWASTLDSILTSLPHGFAWLEVIYRMRPDGKLGWDSWGLRPQTSLTRFVFVDGEVAGVEQQLISGQRVHIPLAKSLHFIVNPQYGPAGRSILRTAYRSWFHRKRLEEFIMLGVERDMGGILVAEIDADVFEAKGDDYQAWVDLVTRSKRGELEGFVVPRAFDEDNNELYKIHLLDSPQGQPRIDALALWRHLAMDIATTVLAQFIGLGRDATGSRALAEPQQNLFRAALDAWADQIADTITSQAFEALLRFNGLDGPTPRMTHAGTTDPDLEAVGQFMLRTAQAGADWFADDQTRQRLASHLAGLLGVDERAGMQISFDTER